MGSIWTCWRYTEVDILHSVIDSRPLGDKETIEYGVQLVGLPEPQWQGDMIALP